MKTQAQALTDLLDRLNETTSSETTGVWTNPQLRRYLNEGVREVARSAEYYDTFTDTSVTTGTQFINYPTDAIRPYRIEFFTSPTGPRYVPEYARKDNLDRVWGWGQVTSTGFPRWWTTSGYPGGVGNAAAKIMLFPKTSQAGTVRIYYYGYPPDLATDGSQGSSALQVPSGWEDLPIDWAEYRAWRQVNNAEAAANALQVFRERLGSLVQATTSNFVADKTGEVIYEPIVTHW